MFIPEDQRPNKKPVDETTMSYIFNFLDEALEVNTYPRKSNPPATSEAEV